jgi:hypothetical protein
MTLEHLVSEAQGRQIVGGWMRPLFSWRPSVTARNSRAIWIFAFRYCSRTYARRDALSRFYKTSPLSLTGLPTLYEGFRDISEGTLDSKAACLASLLIANENPDHMGCDLQGERRICPGLLYAGTRSLPAIPAGPESQERNRSRRRCDGSDCSCARSAIPKRIRNDRKLLHRPNEEEKGQARRFLIARKCQEIWS